MPGFLVFLAVLAVPGGAGSQASTAHSGPASVSIPTELRVESAPWWPTKGSPSRTQYAGRAACATCHAEKAASQAGTPMARASMRAVDSERLKSHPELSFSFGPYTYGLITNNGRSLLSVTRGSETATKNLEWALGDGTFGQSYVYREKGKYYEAQLSLYTALNGLDITTGHSRALPQSIEMAAGGYTSPATIRQCFGCHFTAATTNDRFDPDQSTMGVTCEACHGPGAEHVALMSSGMVDAKGSMMNPAKLNPADSVDFCGACHRTSADAVLQGLSKMGAINVRLQPYRLQKSRCWGKGDARLTCVACHDPHNKIARDAEFYDSKCLGCHRQSPSTKAAANRPGRACRVSTRGCVTCHMPKIEVPEAHSTFTDHWIRTARQGEPYPE